MSRERTTERSTDVRRTAGGPPRREEPNTLMNAIIGAVVTVVTAPLLPLAAIVGGGVAGYLQRADMRAGAKVGAIAGALAAIPAFLFAWFVFAVLLFGGADVFAFTLIFSVVLFVVVTGYLVGAGAAGGALGAYVRREL